MKCEAATLLISFLSLAQAAPLADARNKLNLPAYRLRGREVPQEHSHNRFLDGVRVNLNIDNPAGIQDPVFGLLGNAAAAAGAGTITNLDCLHQATADQAFTNAKAANNVSGMVDALSYAALERNTGTVGLASVICNETAVNPEIEAVQQHQDPASTGAAATNKAVVLALAKQIASVGGDPQGALLTGTFAPGTIGDTTGAGNTCDVADDEPGCIFSENLLVDDATPAEISAAVAGVAVVTGAASNSSVAATTVPAVAASSAAASACAPDVTSTITVAAAATSPATATTPSAAVASATEAATGTTNVQTFTGTLGGAAPPVESTAGSARPFSVDGDTFVNAGAAIQRSCSVQNNACFNAANAGTLSGGTSQCSTQEAACNALISA